MEGLYLYCIRNRTDVPFLSATKGIDGQHEVTTIACRDLEAVVSKVLLEEFDSEGIQIRAREDLNWIKEKAVTHQKVMEEAMIRDQELLALIPMRFGMIFKGEKALKENLHKNYEQFKTTLEKLKGKQEWGLKLYLKDRKALEEAIKEENREIKEKAREMAELPEGIAYFLEKELEELLSQETDREIREIRKDLRERFRKISEEEKESKILGMEITGRPEPMVWNVSCLVKKEKVEAFKSEAGQVIPELKARGFILEYSGPWPPYSFVS